MRAHIAQGDDSDVLLPVHLLVLAACAEGATYFSPSGGTVPNRPVLFATQYPGSPLELKVTARVPVTFNTSVVGRTPGYELVAIFIDASETDFTLEHRRCTGKTCSPWEVLHYQARAAAPRAGHAVEVVSTEEEVSPPICGSWRYQQLELSANAPAVKLESAADEATVLAGKGSVTHHIAGDSVILGHGTCGPVTFEWKNSDVWVRVTPLYADGSSGPPSKPVRVPLPANYTDLSVKLANAWRSLTRR